MLEVITDQPNRISHVESLRAQGMTVKLYDLQAGERMEQALSQGLNGPNQHAKQQLELRFARIGREKLEAQLKTAFQAIIQSVAYQLDRHPAIVFNQGEAVIYGVTDLNQAVSLYNQWKARQ